MVIGGIASTARIKLFARTYAGSASLKALAVFLSTAIVLSTEYDEIGNGANSAARRLPLV
jgi:hypothetical protein